MKLVCYLVTKRISVIMIDSEIESCSFKNAQGRIVGYSGRTYTGQEPKYLNSPETPIFQNEDSYII